MALPLPLESTRPWSARCSSRYKVPVFLWWTEIPFKVKNVQTSQFLEEGIWHTMEMAAQIRETSLNLETLANEDWNILDYMWFNSWYCIWMWYVSLNLLCVCVCVCSVCVFFLFCARCQQASKIHRLKCMYDMLLCIVTPRRATRNRWSFQVSFVIVVESVLIAY